MARVLQPRAITFGAHHRAAHVLQLHQAVRRILDDDVVELFRAGKSADNAHRNLVGLLRVGWRLPQLPGRNLDVLLFKRVHYIGCSQAAGCQPHRIEPHAHGVLARAEVHHIAHTRHALESVNDVDVQVVGDVLV